jgi:nitrate/nitrite transporter NarK
MFTEKVVGSANAITAGFGNFGAALASIMNKNIY